MISRFPQISFLFLSIIFLSFVRLFGLQRNATQRNIVICYNLDKKYWTGNLHTSPYYRWGIQVSGLIRLIQKKNPFFLKKYHRILVPLILLIPEKKILYLKFQKNGLGLYRPVYTKKILSPEKKNPFFFKPFTFNYAMFNSIFCLQ